MKRKKRIVAVSIVVCVLAAAFGIRYKKLNEKYPAAVVMEYSYGDIITLEGFQIKYTNREVLDQEDFFEKYQVEDEIKGYYEHYPTKFLVAEFWIKNIETEENNYYRAFSEDAVEYQAFANGEDINFLKYVNEDDEWDGYLEPEEEKVIKLVYPIPKSLLTKKHWENAKELDYAVVLRNYREKIVIR